MWNIYLCIWYATGSTGGLIFRLVSDTCGSPQKKAKEYARMCSKFMPHVCTHKVVVYTKVGTSKTYRVSGEY